MTSNLTVDTGLDSIDAMVGLAGSVQSLQSHYIQFITVPYTFDPTNQNRVIPGPGFDDVWTALRGDTPLPGSTAAAAFGTAPSAPATPTKAAPAPSADPSTSASSKAASLSGVPVAVYNSTVVPHLALYATQNLKALGDDAQVGPATAASARYSGYGQTEILYPRGDSAGAGAGAPRHRIVGSVTTQPSDYVSSLTLVIGQSRPAGLVAAAGRGERGTGTDARIRMRPPRHVRPRSARRAGPATRTSARTCRTPSSSAATPRDPVRAAGRQGPSVLGARTEEGRPLIHLKVERNG